MKPSYLFKQNRAILYAMTEYTNEELAAMLRNLKIRNAVARDFTMSHPDLSPDFKDGFNAATENWLADIDAFIELLGEFP